MTIHQVRRTVVLVLTLAALLLASCAGAASPTPAPTAAPTATPTVSEEPVDMNGYEFVIASPWMRAKLSANATELEKMFFERKAQVEADYNCTIKIKSVYGDMETLQPMIMAGIKVGDVIDMMSSMWLPASSAGYLIPWDEVPGIDLEDSRFVDSYTEFATFHGKHWGVQFMRPPEVRAAVFFNKDLLTFNGITEDPYALVDSGEWTWEKFATMAKACTKDTNNDGTIDTYGAMAIDPAFLARWLVNSNGSALASEIDGKVVATYDDPKSIAALDFFNRLVNQDKSYLRWDYMKNETTWNQKPAYEDIYAKFTSGKVAFFFCESWVGNQQIKPNASAIHYGMLPVPKGPSGTGYVSASENARIFAIPSTNKDLDKTVIVFKALATPLEGYEGEDWWMEEVQREYFQDDDTRSVDMFQLCLDNAIIDKGNGVQKIWFDFEHAAMAPSIFWGYGTPASQVASMVKLDYQEAIDATYKQTN